MMTATGNEVKLPDPVAEFLDFAFVFDGVNCYGVFATFLTVFSQLCCRHVEMLFTSCLRDFFELFRIIFLCYSKTESFIYFRGGIKFSPTTTKKFFDGLKKSSEVICR